MLCCVTNWSAARTRLSRWKVTQHGWKWSHPKQNLFRQVQAENTIFKIKYAAQMGTFIKCLWHQKKEYSIFYLLVPKILNKSSHLSSIFNFKNGFSPCICVERTPSWVSSFPAVLGHFHCSAWASIDNARSSSQTGSNWTSARNLV